MERKMTVKTAGELIALAVDGLVQGKLACIGSKWSYDGFVNGLDCLSAWCHEAQVQRGWWTDLATGERKERNKGQLIVLMHSEVSEAMEALRKNDRMDDKLPLRKGYEVELADCLIRVFDFAGAYVSVYSSLSRLTLESLRVFAIRRFPTEDKSEALGYVHYFLSRAFQNQADKNVEELSANLSMVICTIVRIGAKWDLDLAGAVAEKMAFNAKRPDHDIEHRRTSAEGKEF